ncbi:MAG: hypothetical protein ACM31C_14985 [Acidobacteriota bacterium]
MKRLLLVVAACGGSAPPPAKPPPGPTTCERIADHLVGMMGASSKATPEQLDPFRRVIGTRCTQDRWSAQAQQCLLAAATLEAGDQCGSQFTPAQKQALDRDGRDALSSMPKPQPGDSPK